MRARYWILALTPLLTACITTAPEPATPRITRELSPYEKSALSKSLAQTLKDPDAVQFRWLPLIVAERDGITDYCAFVNGRNAYGAYIGFTLFYAHLRRNDKGQFDRGEIRVMATDNVMIRATEGACAQFGYSDLTLRQQ